MKLSHGFLHQVSRRVGGSFYIFDDLAFRENYLCLREGLRRHWPRSNVAYAMKANYMPPIGALLESLDGWAEVVSGFEYAVARQSLPAERIIFNGPVKRESDLRLALQEGSHVNLDSFREVEELRPLATMHDRIEVGLRVCFSFPHISSRFGFEVDSGELDRALDILDRIGNIEVVALHCHATCRQRGLEDPVDRVRRLCRLAERLVLDHPIRTINIGGGLMGKMPEVLRAQFPFAVPTLDEYADAIGAAFAEYSPHSMMHLVVEPGISMVADTLCLVAPVMEIRDRRSGLQALLDTSINSINPTRTTTRPALHAVTAHSPKGSVRNFRLVGNTCMENDVICEDFSGHLEPGDFVVVENRGAYSLNYTPPFITPCPAVIDLKGTILKYPDSKKGILASYSQSSPERPETTLYGYSADECRKT